MDCCVQICLVNIFQSNLNLLNENWPHYVRAANVDASMQQRAVVGATWRTFLRGAFSSRLGHEIVVMNAQNQPWHFPWRLEQKKKRKEKKKKRTHKAPQMSEGHGVLRNLYPTSPANSWTCSTEIPPSAVAPPQQHDRQWLVTWNKSISESRMQWSELANEA